MYFLKNILTVFFTTFYCCCFAQKSSVEPLSLKADTTVKVSTIPIESSGLLIEIDGKKYLLKEEEKHQILGMELDKLNVLSQMLAFLGLVVSLIYLARQTRIANKNNLLASFQHTQDNINQFNDALAASKDLAEIVVKGRKSYAKLEETEKLRFEHVYGRLLNILEGWFILAEQQENQDFKKSQVENIVQVIKFYFRYAGVRKFWTDYKVMYVKGFIKLMDENILADPIPATDPYLA